MLTFETSNAQIPITTVVSFILLQGIITMDDLILLTFRMLMKFTYGRDISEVELHELIELRALVGTLIADTFTNRLVKFPLYKYMPTNTNRRLAEFEQRWVQFNKR